MKYIPSRHAHTFKPSLTTEAIQYPMQGFLTLSFSDGFSVTLLLVMTIFQMERFYSYSFICPPPLRGNQWWKKLSKKLLVLCLLF